MNKSERTMAERMSFVTRRGITAECRKRMWLRELRRERNKSDEVFVVNIRGMYFCTARTLRQAKIKALSRANRLRLDYDANAWVAVCDRATGIRLWNK